MIDVQNFNIFQCGFGIGLGMFGKAAQKLSMLIRIRGLVALLAEWPNAYVRNFDNQTCLGSIPFGGFFVRMHKLLC